MRLGPLAVGLVLGAVLWWATDEVAFISVGVVFAIVFGLFDRRPPDPNASRDETGA